MAWVGAAAAIAAVATIVGHAVIGDRRLVWDDVPSWVSGLALVTVGGVALVAAGRRPRFPAGSGLRVSHVWRRIRVR